MPHDCKPVALAAGEMVHLWRPAGIAMDAQDVRLPTTVTMAVLAFECINHSFVAQWPTHVQRTVFCVEQSGWP